jgi:hypothetical protein
MTKTVTIERSVKSRKNLSVAEEGKRRSSLEC